MHNENISVTSKENLKYDVSLLVKQIQAEQSFRRAILGLGPLYPAKKRSQKNVTANPNRTQFG